MRNKDQIDVVGKKLLICEEALSDYKGHFYSWIKAIRKIHLKAGAEVLVAANKSVDDHICREFDCLRIYDENSWNDSYNSKGSFKRYLNVFIHNFKLVKRNRALLRRTGKVDCILLPAVRIYHLIGWRILTWLFLGKKFDRLILFVLTSEAIYDADYQSFHFKKSSLLIKTILRSFKREVLNGRVVLAGDSIITCKEYEKLTGVSFKVFPSPAAGLNAISLSERKEDHNSCTFVTLGVSSMEKGINILQDAIISFLNKSPGVKAKFILQWANSFKDYDGNEVSIRNELRNFPQVTLIEKVLDEEEYRYYMQAADFIVLPYRRNIYYNRISGVAIEAACSGIPMIVTENTWLDMAMNQYGAGISVKDGDVEDLENKINEAILNSARIKEQALEKQSIAIEQNSSSAYLECVWN